MVKGQKIIRGCMIWAALLALTLMFLCSGCGGSKASDETVSKAALDLAELDYGYKLDLKSYNIVDSFTAKSKNQVTGVDFKGEMYLVILEADVKDAEGNIVETVKYGISVVDPEKAGDYVTYSPLSQAADCTGMEDAEIEEILKGGTVAYH